MKQTMGGKLAEYKKEFKRLTEELRGEQGPMRVFLADGSGTTKYKQWRDLYDTVAEKDSPWLHNYLAQFGGGLLH